jgi:hypothetical protein
MGLERPYARKAPLVLWPFLRRRNTIISLADAPFFYALSPNYGDPENDYLDQYEQGQMTNEARKVYEALFKEGPLDSINLRRASQLASANSSTRFNRALKIYKSK